ncbi:MAG: beta-propeller fold lactonase family protein [Caldilineaceae bacterium]|nr:beta-propeller fold lactonase family protein [Caldilineaceae bacterium]
MPYIAYMAIGGENKLLRFELNPTDGALTLQRELALEGAPGPLAVDPTQRILYVGLRSTCRLVSFQIEPKQGELTPLGSAVVLDSDPCYLATDKSGRFLLAAYYRGGKATVHPLQPDGTIGSTAVCTLPTMAYAHCIETDPTNRFTFLPHVAESNTIVQLRFEATTGQLTPNTPAQLLPPPGTGPRHYVYHPTQPMVYFSNEQAGSVTAYQLDRAAGTLTPVQTLSTLPAAFRGENTCAQIHIDPAGRFLYVSNRGHDSIACFAMNADGSLTTLGQQATEPIPRAFNVDPTGNFLYVSGQGSGRLAAYRIHPQRGTLQPLTTYAIGERPMWVMLLAL